MTKQHKPIRIRKKIKYYPVSIEKLQQASMKEAAYLIAPVNIGEDYEYFEEVKHLLDIPPQPKSLEQIQKELDEKFEKLLVQTRSKFAVSKNIAEIRFEKFCHKQDADFEYAKEHGQFPQKSILTYSTSLGTNNIASSFIIKQGNKHEGYYTIGNGYLRFYMPYKPNAITRWFMDKCLSIRWVDEK